MPPWTLVSPASRGIGFALARRVLQTTDAPLVATARRDLDQTKEKLLAGLMGVDEKRVTVLKVDVLDESTIAEAAAKCKDLFPTMADKSNKNNSNPLQLGFLVPGILYPEKAPGQIDADDALLTFRTNTLGPMLLLKHFAGFLPRKNAVRMREEDGDGEMRGLPDTAMVAVMSARVGSISDNRLGGWYSYRASKAGVNQIVKTFDNHLRTASGDRAAAVALHPGTVRTGLSREFWGSVKREKLFEGEWVAEALVDVVLRKGLEGRGRCWDFEGREVMP